MTRDDIIRMARDAGAAKFYPIAQETKEDSYLVGVGFLERFAALVAAAERDEVRQALALHRNLARMAADEHPSDPYRAGQANALDSAYAAIRARQ